MQVLDIASRQWATRPADQRFETLDEMRTYLRNRKLGSVGFTMPTSDIVVDTVDVTTPEGMVRSELLVGHPALPSAPSHWAFGQLCSLVQAPANFLRKLPVNITRDALAHCLQYTSLRGEVGMYVYQEDGENTLQAITGPGYGRIFCADVADAVAKFVESTGGKFFNPPDWSKRPSGLFASPTDSFILMVDGGSIVNAGRDAQGRDDILYRGFIVWNSEVGKATLRIFRFYFRWVCGNLMIHGVEELQEIAIRHSARAPWRFMNEAEPGINQFIHSSVSGIEHTIKAAQQYMLPSGQDELLDFLRKRDFTTPEAKGAVEYAKREEGDARTLWQLHNGATAYARVKVDHMDDRIDLVSKAGKLLEIVA